MDTGATCALISTECVEQYGTPAVRREIPLSRSTFAGAILLNPGKRYMDSLRVRHGEHVTIKAFEISRSEESSDIILPHWRMIDHLPIGLLEGKTISFTSSWCQSRSTQYALSTFPIRYDNIIATANAPTTSKLSGLRWSHWLHRRSRLPAEDRDYA